jgi:hypothetical protein
MTSRGGGAMIDADGGTQTTRFLAVLLESGPKDWIGAIGTVRGTRLTEAGIVLIGTFCWA